MRTLALAAAVLWVTLVRAEARADEVPPAPESVEAQAHADRGKRLLAENDFVAAAAEFEEAERFFASLARAPDGSVRDRDADERRRHALAAAAAAWSLAD